MQYLSKNNFSIVSCIFLFSIWFLLMACQQPKIANVTDIPPLHLLEAPKNHYVDLAKLSAQPNEAQEELDAIRFPNKKFDLLIKTFGPAYTTRDQIQELMLTLHPPANSSEQTRAELDFLLELQKTRTPEQVAFAERLHEVVYFPLMVMNSDEDLFCEAYEIFGSDFNPSTYPKTKKLLKNIMKEMRIMEFTAKNHFLRARPRQLEPELKPLKKMNTSSFASGHTLWAYMQAYVWAELIPAKRKEFLELAYQIGFSREILGVHYPSDEETARKLAHQLLTLMWDHQDFKNDFQQAKMEWKKGK